MQFIASPQQTRMNHMAQLIADLVFDGAFAHTAVFAGIAIE